MFRACLIPLHATLAAQLIFVPTYHRILSAAVCLASTTLAVTGTMKSRMKKYLAVLGFGVLGIMLLSQVRQVAPSNAAVLHATSLPMGRLGGTLENTHPIDQLIRGAELEWSDKIRGQSQTLQEAVTEYKRRHGIPPPPKFDQWYEFARENHVQLIDEYDTIHHALLPFWALSPAHIRATAREALGFGPNNLMGMLIRNGEPTHIESGPLWLQEAVVSMVAPFVQHLPDMDLAFNIHDEPRIVVPQDALNRLVQLALNATESAAAANRTPRNSFSATPKDLNYTNRIPEVKTTLFNVFAHQPTWSPSTLSCPIDSPARSLSGKQDDDLTSYAFGNLGFIYNQTAFTDVCNSPSFATSHGFFDRPNAFNVAHMLAPVFSQSKMLSFSDITYPSPWYFAQKVKYDAEKDMSWQAKIESLWWRGSTTGGFSRDGGWRNQHRQQIVQKLNALGNATIIQNMNRDTPEATPVWQMMNVSRQEYKQMMNVHFSDIGQCDPGDCDAQHEFFDVAKPADQQEAWQYKFLLDMDGNAFSGRFYAFLQSQSLTIKAAVFSEWHQDWIKPWVHYIPLSLRAEEALEAVRYLSVETEGKQHATRIAGASTKWANEALRNVDFQAYFFRLLLEYARLVDEEREMIGFAGQR